MPSSKKLKVLFVTSELFPFVKTGGLADVSASLPQRLTELGHEVRILVPKYGAIDSRKYKIHDVVRLKDLTVKIGDEEVFFSVKSSFLPSQKVRVQIYFLDNEQYYGSRKSLYHDPMTGKEYNDNDERFILLSQAVFELINKLGWIPDILHINDWQCGLIPAYFKTTYADDPNFKKMKTLFTIHNFSFPGAFPKAAFNKTNLPKELGTTKGIIQDSKLNFLKAGVMFADSINTVSDGYAKQVLKSKELSSGLNRVLTKRKNEFYGLVNGIDYTVWNPEKDKFIPKKYSLKNVELKKQNKTALAERFNLEYAENIPIISVISRLNEYKGIDLLADAFPELMKRDVQVILLGTGERKYHTAFDKFARKYAGKFSSYLGFSDELAHLIEAGSDMLLMPSKHEPCGLNQMYSLVYGTVPIVRATGGLADTVQRFVQKTGEGNGFMFKEYSVSAMMKEIDRAIKQFHNPENWQKLIKNGMKTDCSWRTSAKRYTELYKTVLNS